VSVQVQVQVQVQVRSKPVLPPAQMLCEANTQLEPPSD
jgi:hypothetical protein